MKSETDLGLLIHPDLSRAETLPSEWYFDPAILDLELRSVFASTWQLIGSSEQLQNAGDYVTTEVAGEPLLLVRGDDGDVRALSNVCRHRGGRVARGSGNRRSFQCTYHGWTYSADGRLKGAPEFEGVEEFDRAACQLPRFEVAEWGPLLFVKIGDDGPSLQEWSGPVLEQMAIDRPEEFRHVARKDWILDCNWKVYVDNYLEGYHIPIVHPQLFRELDYGKYRTETARFFSIQHAPIRRPERLRSPEDGNEAQYFWLFPNLMLNVYPDNFSTNLIVPLGPERTLTIFEWYFREGARPNDTVVEETIRFSDEIQYEDIEVCEEVQKGLRSRTYDRGRYSVRRENGVHHFHQLLEEFTRPLRDSRP